MLIGVFVLLTGCQEENYVPKPRGFFRIDFETKHYQTFDENWPCLFEYPAYSRIVHIQNQFSEPYWINISTGKYHAQIHLSYKPVANNLEELINDAHELAYKHALKASSIDEQLFINEQNHVYGTLFDIKGNAASPMQFYLTDSLKHFMRGSFYISETPNYDSLFPVIQYFEEDVRHLMETLIWK